MAYQDAWIRGEIHRRGDRACAERYDVIRGEVARYQRPVTVWDLGANLGYFGCRLADEFGCVSVMVEPRQELAAMCQSNGIPTTVAMTRRLTAADLTELAASEHADVVLALNVLHHMDDWQAALGAVLALGETCIIETPSVGDVGSANYARAEAILEALTRHSAEPIGQASSHVTPGVQRTLYRVRQPKTALTRGYAYGKRVRARGAHDPRPHVITSTLEAKSIAFADGESRSWMPGMNLWNWAQMGGSYPSRQAVQSAVRSAALGSVSPHGDFRPWNLILQGETVQVIDGGHRRSVDDHTGLADTLAWVDRPELAYVA